MRTVTKVIYYFIKQAKKLIIIIKSILYYCYK